MPVYGAPNSNVTPAQGVTIPPGSLDTWKAARATHASALVEICMFGDSTWFGQTTTGAAGTFRPISNKMRELLIADGFTSAGRGYIHGGVSDEASLAGQYDPVGFTARTGFALSDSYGFAYSFKSNAQNDEVTLRGKGTRARLWYGDMNIGGDFTYSVNGAAPVTVANVPPSGGVYRPNFVYLTGLPGGGAVNTIRVVNTSGGRMNVMGEFFNDTGIVIHNQGIQGAGSGVFSVTAADNNCDVSAQLGLDRAITGRPSEQALLDTKTGSRRPKLAIYGYGVNDVQTASSYDTTLYAANTAHFIRMARQAGADPVIVLPVVSRLVNGRTYGPGHRIAARNVAAAYSVATIDPNIVLGPINQWPTRYPGESDGGTNPHLGAAMYDAIATAAHTYIIKAP